MLSRKTLFYPRERKQEHAVELEKDGQAEDELEIEDLWVVFKRGTRHADIGDVYGVGSEGKDGDS